MRPEQKTREQQEKAEDLKTLEHDVPGTRFQRDQQVNPAAEGNDTTPAPSEYRKVKAKGTGSRVKQDVAAKVITMENAGGDALNEGSTAAAVLGYDGGSAGNVAGSAAYTPKVGQSRSDTRYGKKLDATAKKLNFVPSEQVEVDYDESKPLAQSPDSVQGYNGTYRNVNARAQKVSGAVPGALMFQRSVDEISRDQLYYITGQDIDTGVTVEDVPTQTAGQGEDGNITYAPYNIRRGDYIPRALHIQFNTDGKLDKFYFDVDDISTTASNPVVINSSSVNKLIDANAAEMNRQKMDDKAGDEKADLWTPLARAVKEPTQTVAYLRDIENITGSTVWMAYKKTALCQSYQLNRAAKDGQQVVTPMKEALLGTVYPAYSQSTYEGYNVFDGAQYMHGTADLYIAAMDTVRKYKTKADLLLQPRSFKTALQTADNNMNPLRLKATFAQVVNNREVFSTIDRAYDPLLPVCISDKEALIYPYDFNDLYAWKSRANGVRVYENNPFKYAYSDLRNYYLVEVATPLLKGIADYFEDNAFSYINAQCLSNANAYKPTSEEIVIPIVHSTTTYSLWDIIVLAATPYIAKARVNSMRDILYYEKNVEYPFSQLLPIKECNPMNAVNYSNPDYSEPIKAGVMVPSTAITWVFPEMFFPFDEKATGDSYSMILPWYFNEQDFNFTVGGTLSRRTDSSTMTMFSLRDETRFAFLDLLYSMEERDIRLCLDRMTTVPIPASSSADSGVYKYDQNSDGIPYTTYAASDLTYGALLSTPREEGFFAVAPGAYLSPDPDTNETAALTDATFGQTSYRVKCWAGTKLALNPEVNNSDEIAVSRAKAYVQTWYMTDALMHTSEAGPADNGFTFSFADLFSGSSLKQGKGIFIPFTNGVSSGASGAEGKQTDYATYGLVSTQKAIWTRIQKLPFAISPFDASAMYRKAGEDAVKVDPFDILYSFGLCGFRASDYREDTYNRENQIVDQGFTFLQDPWVRANPIFKESIDLTETYNAGKLTEVIS